MELQAMEVGLTGWWDGMWDGCGADICDICHKSTEVIQKVPQICYLKPIAHLDSLGLSHFQPMANRKARAALEDRRAAQEQQLKRAQLQVPSQGDE
jgi:hypothetical protein